MVFHLLLVSLKGYVQVGVAIISLKTTKHTGVVQLGAARLTIWKFILNVPPPLSPPSFIHISLAGITPLCQLNNLEDQVRNEHQRGSSKLFST
eukprot:Em0007g1492a